MRWAAVLAFGMTLAGCIDLGGSPPPPVTTTLDGAMVFRAEGDIVVPVAMPAEFGGGFTVRSVATGFAGAEPNIGVTANGSVFVSAFEKVLRSRDQGETWDEVYATDIDMGQNYDPMLWVDVPTGRVYAMHIYPSKTCSILIYSDNADADNPDWQELPLRCPSPVVDHQKLATGAFAGVWGATGTAMPYPRMVTLCYNKVPEAVPAAQGVPVTVPVNVAATRCAVSLDGGVSYVLDAEVDRAPGSDLPQGIPANCGGLNGHQAHGPNGTIFLPYGYACRRGRVAVSENGGVDWMRHDLQVDQLEIDPEVAVTVDGTAYYVYRGGDQALHFLRSRDAFRTVEGPFRVSPPEVKGTVFVAVAAGSAGRLAFAYLGTPDSDAGPDDVPDSAVWNLYTGMTLDADSPAPTIVTVQANPPSDPVQRGSICHSKACTIPSNRNLLDFIDAAVGPDGRFWVSYTDGCASDACRPPGRHASTSRDDTASVAWLHEGPSLFAGRPRLAGP